MRGSFVDAEWRLPDDPAAPPVSYRAWVPAAISDLAVDLPESTLRLACEAEAAVTQFSHSDQAHVTRGTHLAAEAMASTMIEDVYPSPKNFPLALFLREGRPQEKAAVSNFDAIESALLLGGATATATLDDLLTIHTALTARLPGYRHAPGVVRARQNWIAPFNWMDREGMRLGPAGPNVDYVPPPPEHLPALLDDFVAFLNRDDLQPVVHCAIAHARFQELHPFIDGNGRTGRALTQMMWRRAGLLPADTCVPLSVPMVGGRDDYIGGLVCARSFTSASDVARAFQPVVELFAACALRAQQIARATAAHLLGVVERHQRRLSFTARSFGWRTLLSLTSQPVVSSASICFDQRDATHGGYGKRQPRRVIERLREIGVVRLLGVRNWERLYVADEIADTIADCFRGALGSDGYDLRIDEHTTSARPQGEIEAAQDRFLLSSVKKPCAVWMPKAKMSCALSRGHSGPHRSRKPWTKR